MNPIVKKDILNVIEEAIEIVKKNQLFKLRELSDHVIHNATIFQDKDSITVAVTIYALSKLYKDTSSVGGIILPHLKSALKMLQEGDMNGYESEMKNIIQDIISKDDKTKFYIQEVLELAQIKKASKMFEHGISMGQVADALGISIWDIMEYVGKTRIVDQFEYKTDAVSKLKFTRMIFNGGQA